MRRVGTGRIASMKWIAVAIPIPSMMGIMRSLSTRAGCSFATIWSASRPFRARSTSYPSSSSANWMAEAMLGSSSTTRMRVMTALPVSSTGLPGTSGRAAYSALLSVMVSGLCVSRPSPYRPTRRVGPITPCDHCIPWTV